jgi:secreted PhoX family phosphatase
MFIADSAGDLSAGTLYVAQYISAFNGTTPGNIKWIKLGHATSAEIEALGNTGSLTAVTTVGGIKENGILQSTTTDPSDASFAEVKLSGNSRWVKLKAGQDKAAAFLETHRYAALKGGSLIFTKMEGTTVNVKDKLAYSAISAISAISASLVAGHAANKEAPLGGGGLIASLVGFASNNAGMVVQHKLGGNQADSDGNLINSDWVPYQSTMLINGAQMAADAMGNTNVVDKISSPDNLKFSEKLRTLFIGEDSGNHVSNFVWAYEVDTGRLQRLLSSPAGAECTGLHGVDDLNGWTYVLSGFQHAGDYTGGTVQAVKDAAGPVITTNYKGLMKSAAIGYVSGTSVAVRLTK